MTKKTPSAGYVEAWGVASASAPDKEYTVSKRADGTFACSCPYWKFHQNPKPRCEHILAVAINAPRPGAYTCSLCGFNTDEWVQMLMHRNTCLKAPTVTVSANKLKPETARALAEVAKAAVAQVQKAEPDGLERFTVRRKFKLTD